MTRPKDDADSPRLLDKSGLAALLEALTHRGYNVIGPVARDGAILLDQVQSLDDLPAGYIDEQSPGHYRLTLQQGQALFAYGVGPQSWKKYLHPAEVKLWSAERQDGTFRILNNEIPPKQPLAFFGVRPCDLAAITIQDRVLTRHRYHDPIYCGRRKGAFLVVVQCTQAASTCFCASLGSGPRAKGGFDLALTELINDEAHRFVVHSGTKRGAKLLAELQAVPATQDLLQQETEALEAAAHQQVRKLNTDGIKELLYRSFDDPRWEKIAGRCLTCANCTSVCPTCFCTTVEDANNLTVDHAERWRRWDSCFTLTFSYIHGGSVRASATARYRQWVTHKFAAWIDQFETLGCVGCGRCITWCPVGIDVTEGIQALREGDSHGNA
jgi:formate hydrogenlyase subunit 6/NADH:ubiquinone oxidoreductase subunit I